MATAHEHAILRAIAGGKVIFQTEVVQTDLGLPRVLVGLKPLVV